MPIDRTVFDAAVDDDGTGTSGTIKDKAWYEAALLDPMDAALAEIEGGGSPLTPPPPHATSHQNGGSDEINVAGLSGLLADGQTPLAHNTSHQSGGSDAIKLDDLATPDDNTDLNVSTTRHGLMSKLPGGTTNFYREDGTWQAPAGGSGSPGGADTQIQFNNAGAFGGAAGLTYVSGVIHSSTQLRARMYHNTTQSLSTATNTALAFNSESFDVGGLHDPATNNSRLTIPSGGDGVYLVTGNVHFAANGNGRRAAYIRKNGATFVARSELEAVEGGSEDTAVPIVTIVALVATDYVELIALQDSGGNLNVNPSSAEMHNFCLVKLW